MTTKISILFFLLIVLFACKNRTDIEPTVCICNTAPLIIKKDTAALYFPSAITPNGDGINDAFAGIFTKGIKRETFHLAVYDDKANVIYQSDSVEKRWLGNDAQGVVKTALYQYKVSFTTLQGSNVDTCGCIKVFYHHYDSCLTQQAKMYFFPDQFDPVSGNYPYPTAENFCP